MMKPQLSVMARRIADSLLKLSSVDTKDDDEGYYERDEEADARDGD